MRVDLPEPDGPMMATYSPSWMERLTPRSAATEMVPGPVDLRHPLQIDHRVTATACRGSDGSPRHPRRR